MTTAQIFAAGMFLLLFMSKNVTSDYLFFLIFFFNLTRIRKGAFFFSFLSFNYWCFYIKRKSKFMHPINFFLVAVTAGLSS